jgi:hypothetical protein
MAGSTRRGARPRVAALLVVLWAAGLVHAAAAQRPPTDQAVLETRQPDVQWSAAGAASWVTVPDRQPVQTGDRVRTGPGARARLVYFEGTITEVGPETGILVQRLERGGDGNLLVTLFQSVGTTVSRVLALAGAPPEFQVETPAAVALVRGTTPRVYVAPDGTTRVANLPEDDAETLVLVRGKDLRQTEVRLPPGFETFVAPGLAPTEPQPLQPLGASAGTAGLGAEGPGATTQLAERQRRIAEAQAAVAQAQLGLIAIQAELNRLVQQEQMLVQQVLLLLTATPTATPGCNAPACIAAGLVPDGSGPCATQPGQVCHLTGSLAGSSGTVVGSMQWRITVPAGLIPAGAVATIFIPTTRGIEFFDCPPAGAGAPTGCLGTTSGNGLQGGTVRVFVSNQQVVQGTIAGPGVVFPTFTPTPTPTPSATATASATATVTATPSATSLVPSPSPTVTRTPTATALPTATPTAAPSPTPTPPPSPTATDTPTATSTPTPSPTATSTPTPTPTATSTATPSPTMPSCRPEAPSLRAFAPPFTSPNTGC